MSDSQALTEFDMVTVQGQAGLSPSESETVTSYTVRAAAADLSYESFKTSLMYVFQYYLRFSFKTQDFSTRLPKAQITTRDEKVKNLEKRNKVR